jgi:hypothetical protein
MFISKIKIEVQVVLDPILFYHSYYSQRFSVYKLLMRTYNWYMQTKKTTITMNNVLNQKQMNSRSTNEQGTLYCVC